MSTPYKFVAVLNKKIEVGRVMNALAHSTAGLVGQYHNDDMEIIEYADKDGGAHYASKHPFIILRAKNGNQIRTLRNSAAELGIPCASFQDQMIVGTWEEQVEASAKVAEEDLEYFGIVLFGKREVLDDLTKKFSLWT